MVRGELCAPITGAAVPCDVLTGGTLGDVTSKITMPEVQGRQPHQDRSISCVFAGVGSGDERCAVTLLPGCETLVITCSTGDVYEVSLPCRAASVRALPHGLLIERMPFADEAASVFGPAAGVLSPNASIFFRSDGKMPRDVMGARAAVMGLLCR